MTNWPPRRISPDTGLFYAPERNGFNLLYLTDPDPRGSMGLGGKTVAPVGSAASFLTAITPQRARSAGVSRSRARRARGGTGGVLATAGGLVFRGDAGGNFVALDAATGKPLWHARIGNISKRPRPTRWTAVNTPRPR